MQKRVTLKEDRLSDFCFHKLISKMQIIIEAKALLAITGQRHY